MNSQDAAGLAQPTAGTGRTRRFLTVNGVLAICLAALVVVTSIAVFSQSGSHEPRDPTSRMVSIVQSHTDYVLEFAADFGGDPEDYLPVSGNAPFDFRTMTALQLGDAFRIGVETVPPRDMPADLDLRAVDWATVGRAVERVVAEDGRRLFTGEIG